ncbi:acetyl-CoA carboxylase biotin carboxyl carrier protein subunit [Paracoccus aestuariivivens]|uniref:Acetyl-CoA carboxylase biotin carboxyl carrier protein subunit n=1 Tax=Paracoccus aestuariivivens TaxID=1820333 RepID=A0A6L6JFH4_9RHOB|nr:acetyl-CoA carboxylase biotin carboxyl carrier protein subunit [Paracoccus aestuariivivens]MTH80015.1 acetyl-CoA carboxylase biotin carboxyl carrier protein subunit [Paracoccus aestuariivivens]
MNRTPVISELSGLIWELCLAPGDAVEEGQAVLLLESMKMEIPALAPVAGRISEILVAKDDVVETAQILAWIE